MTQSNLAANIRALRIFTSKTQAAFAKKVGTAQPNVAKWERGVTPDGAMISRLAAMAGVDGHDFQHKRWVAPGQSTEVSDIPPIVIGSSGDGSVQLKRLNLGLAMGAGWNLDDYIEEQPVEFDPNWLRALTQAPPNRLYIADGHGDSMFPTIQDHDWVMFDTTQTELNKIDRIWVISLFGAGAVKRLRPVSDTEVEVVSDSDMIENRVHHKDDVRLIGRVIWSGRRH
jgi:transcriptional regulator with XRE-family HTH domain